MTVYVALLRGINVGGRSKLPMADLRRIATECGFGNVRTYIQSGNLAFTSDDPVDGLAATLRSAIAAEGGPDPAVAVRTRDELAAVVAANPYADRAPEDKQLHVAFAVDGATPRLPAGLDLAAFAPDELTIIGREVYLYLPNGLGRSKLAEVLSRQRDQQGTVRNWRTVTTLLALADELGDAAGG